MLYRSSALHVPHKSKKGKTIYHLLESNQRPSLYESDALPLSQSGHADQEARSHSRSSVHPMGAAAHVSVTVKAEDDSHGEGLVTAQTQ